MKKKRLEAVKQQQIYKSCIRQTSLASDAGVTQPIVSRFLSCEQDIAVINFEKIIKHLFGDKAKWSDYGDYIEPDIKGKVVSHTSRPVSIALPEKSRVRYGDYTQQFQSFIDQRIEGFVGRQFIYDHINDVKNSRPSGYISVVGNPGDGKSAIAANYLQRHPTDNAFFFNIRKDNINTKSAYLKSICGQLSDRFGINIPMDNAANWNDGLLLRKLLERIEVMLEASKKTLTFVVDALDESKFEDTELGENMLYLPQQLPPRIYCLMTYRRTFELRSLEVSNNSPIDLSSNRFKEYILSDVRSYIERCLSVSDFADELWLRIRELQLSKDDFVDIMFEKSRGNFMYLTLVTEEIAKGTYKQLDKLSKLPNGLTEYYEQHWELLAMDKYPFRRMVLRAFLNSAGAVSLSTIGDYVNGDNKAIDTALIGWWQFLQLSVIGGEKRFQLYHESFREFLDERTKREEDVVDDMMLDAFENY